MEENKLSAHDVSFERTKKILNVGFTVIQERSKKSWKQEIFFGIDLEARKCMEKLRLEDFPLQTFDKVRYTDTDRQGHVNNALFATFLETGRVEVLYNPQYPILAEGASFVIASLKLDFLREITWPGLVDTGTGILKIGNSSISVYQKLFQNGHCVASAETVIVQIDDLTGRGSPLTDLARSTLSNWLLNEDDA